MKRHHSLLGFVMAAATVFALAAPIAAQGGGMEVTTLRGADEGDGPHERLILRGVTYIDGAGSPPLGPVDIVVEGDRIAEIRSVGFPGVPIDERRRPGDPTREIDLTGHYVLPGFVDMHAHTRWWGQGAAGRVHVQAVDG